MFEERSNAILLFFQEENMRRIKLMLFSLLLLAGGNCLAQPLYLCSPWYYGCGSQQKQDQTQAQGQTLSTTVNGGTNIAGGGAGGQGGQGGSGGLGLGGSATGGSATGGQSSSSSTNSLLNTIGLNPTLNANLTNTSPSSASAVASPTATGGQSTATGGQASSNSTSGGGTGTGFGGSATGGTASANGTLTNTSPSNASSTQSQSADRHDQTTVSTQGGASQAASSNNGSNISIDAHSQVKESAKSAYAGAQTVIQSDSCNTGWGAGGQTIGFGISLSGTVADQVCERIKLSRELVAHGLKQTAVKLLRQDPRVAEACKASGEC